MGYPATHPAARNDLSPMMLRYLEYKDRYPDALLFFQVGDFYELFFDDAVTVAKALNLTLTSRDKNQPQPIPMCGVPLAVLDGYVDRLLPLGYSVAVVTQTGSGQGVERALERFVTPGMRLFTSVSSDTAESLIAAIALEGDGKGAIIAYTDPQTGVIRVRDGIEAETLGREIGTVAPREVVLPVSINGTRIDRRTSWVRSVEVATAAQAIRFRNDGSSDADKLISESARSEFHSLSGAGKRCLRLLLAYLDEVSLGNALPISEISIARDSGVTIIDAATRRNLELVANSKDGGAEGTLFSYVNHTATPGGARLLRNWVVAPLCDQKKIVERQDGVTELLPAQEDLRAALQGLSDLERLAARLQLNVASPRDLGAIRDVLDRLPSIVSILSTARSAALVRLRDALCPPSEISDLLRQALVDSPPHTSNEGGIIREGYDEKLDEIRALRATADEWRASFEQRERATTGISNLKVRSNNVIGFFIEIGSAHSGKAPQHYQRRQSTANADRFITPELKQHEDAVVTAVDRQYRRETELFNALRDRVRGSVDTLRAIAKAIAEIDVFGSLAAVAAKDALARPAVMDSRSLEISAGRHPIISKLLEGRFIPNSVQFQGDGSTCFLITGPNMGGKSTYLRQTALITILAQMGSYVPAKSATVGIVDRIFARLGASDDLHEGDSTFMVEMREAAHIISNASDRSLVLIDELGRGTATSDGLALAQAILERLVKEIGCRTLFATHYHELTGLVSTLSGLENLSVGSVEEEDRVIFTHEIKSGPAPRSYGLEVAKLSGLPADVLERAAVLLFESEQQERSGRAATRQRGLFDAPPPRPQKIIEKDPVAERLIAAVRQLDIDALTPRQALETLYSLSEICKGSVKA